VSGVYIDHYLEMLQNDKRALFQAATAASAAVDYILAFSRPQQKEEAA
jgi:antirestriction protein ArdC